MPTYTFRNTETGEEFDKFMKIAECDDFLKENPNIQLLLSSPMIVSSVSVGSSNNKVPEGFKEVLAKVGENHPDSRLGREYGNKTNAQIKAREIVRKHREKKK